MQVTAGLRWRKSRQGFDRPSLLQGVGLVSVENDDYIRVNSTHAPRPPVFNPKMSSTDKLSDRSYSNASKKSLSTDPSLVSARYSSFFQEDGRSIDRTVGSDGRIKSRIGSLEDDSLRV